MAHLLSLRPMKSRLHLIACILAIAEQTFAADTANDQRTLWNRERAYWQHVEKNDLAAYRNLWHEDFLGWPAISASPVGKNHITDWITSQTSKGLTFKAGEFKPAALKVTGDVAFACYWITFRWVDKDGNGEAHTLRITHAWLRNGNDWRIIGGMSMSETGKASK
jgi:ketosteroid isomerase-like protein